MHKPFHRSISLWLFDLDNTLHHASPDIFLTINQYMSTYLANKLRLTLDEANQIRIQYWQQYGATVKGVVKHHQFCPHDFLAHTHPLDVILPQVVPTLGIQQLWRRLPGRKVIFTNGPRQYAHAVCKKSGVLIQNHRDMIALEDMTIGREIRPKPDLKVLRKVLQRYRVKPKHVMLVDDTLCNLRAAKKLGIRTLWVTKAAPQAQFCRGGKRFVDHRLKYAVQILQNS